MYKVAKLLLSINPNDAKKFYPKVRFDREAFEVFKYQIS